MGKLLIATQNRGKRAEIKALLKGSAVELVFPQEINLDLDVAETGETYAENAALKAQTYAQASGLFTLADDSGLEVDVLDGQPGLHSARFAPQPNATDADRRAYLLGKLAPHPRPWRALFRCVVALTAPEGECYFVAGTCLGEIIPQERGEHGFGYDPIFMVESTGKTMAELVMEEKNKLSHRARAVTAARPILEQLLG
jgi:XTP/dITP diphosphohydrolase